MAIPLDPKQIASFEELPTPQEEGKEEWKGVVEVSLGSNLIAFFL